MEAQILREAWHGKQEAAPTRTLTEAITSYLDHADRSPGMHAMLARIVKHFGDVPLSAINQEAVDKARAAILRPGAAPATVRRNLIVPLRAVMIHASKRDWCPAPRFDAPPEPKGRTLFMLPDQVDAIIGKARPHLAPLLRFLICTGCRMSEALALEWRDVDLVAGRAILWEGETKGGGRRVVDLPPAAVAALTGLADAWRYRAARLVRPADRWLQAAASGRIDGDPSADAAAVLADLPPVSGCVFLTHKGQPYRDSEVYGGQIKSAWATTTKAAKVDGFTPHHLRHTWATWHYAIHRDLLRLKVDGGWSSVALVERYAHIMPAGHEADIRRVWGEADG
ncbi:MAG: tyrosine-type recombinase/integrase [Acetobacteraceae bacterium]